MNELLEENKNLRERLAHTEQQSQSQPTTDVRLNDSSSMSSLEDTPQPQNGFFDKIIVKQRFRLNILY